MELDTSTTISPRTPRPSLLEHLETLRRAGRDISYRVPWRRADGRAWPRAACLYVVAEAGEVGKQQTAHSRPRSSGSLRSTATIAALAPCGSEDVGCAPRLESSFVFRTSSLREKLASSSQALSACSRTPTQSKRQTLGRRETRNVTVGLRRGLLQRP